MYSTKPYRVGDVIEPSYDFAPEGIKGVVIVEPSQDEPHLCVVYWYNFYQEVVFTDEIVQCEGITDNKLCSVCEHNSLCPHMPDIARCDISKFGEYRGEGKYNPDVCKQRQCEYLGVCLTNRFILQ